MDFTMGLALDICLFTLNRVRTVMLALSLIIMLKLAWVTAAPALPH
jgi:hypothetical protein